MAKLLHTRSSIISRSDIILVAIILCAGIYKIITEPSIVYVLIISILLPIFLITLFVHDEVVIEDTGDGVIESRMFMITRVEKYRYAGLSDATVEVIQMLGGESDYQLRACFLKFNNGYQLRLPVDDSARFKVLNCLRENFNVKLNIVNA